MATLRILLLCFLSAQLSSQYDHIPVFPTLDGEELKMALIENFKTDQTLTLSQARDTLYKRVYAINNMVSCVYSGFQKSLIDGQDPSQTLFGDGSPLNINLEHSYPRSKGADSGLASSDMHALVPSRVDVNSQRSSDPYGDIPDSSTERWFFEDQTLTTIPSVDMDLYSEDSNEKFEPREDFKGNVARAAFYFFTMYRDEAIQADPDFFATMNEDLCQWHIDDPVDSLEWTRNNIIASYQNDNVNPFVLDCSLSRLYCDEIPTQCFTLDTKDLEDLNYFIYPNLVEPGQPIKIEGEGNLSDLVIKFLNLDGQPISVEKIYEGRTSIEILAPIIKGHYILMLLFDGSHVYIERILVF